jgi:hypothetical protein
MTFQGLPIVQNHLVKVPGWHIQDLQARVTLPNVGSAALVSALSAVQFAVTSDARLG